MSLVNEENLYKRGSEGCKSFIVEEIRKEDEYFKIEGKLKETVETDERAAPKKIEMMLKTLMLLEKFKEKMRLERNDARRNVRCYSCGRREHTEMVPSRHCKTR
ncbi:hypothetical protein NGRA_2327 [Nosema granulosis]|uniref:Uncharacterized protein n=1 Tax=Nosema granulosis TaxID=83296 RepID=A0A9P6GXP7_9MICR|nr:hypothetical protein NGRA_2327 [Nosema granulosis]